MITSIAFTVYPVSDVARSRHFYEQVIGLTAGESFQGEGSSWMEYEVGGSTLAITDFDLGHPPGTKGAVVAFETDELDSFVGRLKEQGVRFVLEIMGTPVCRMAVIEDTDGNHLTIHQRNS